MNDKKKKIKTSDVALIIVATILIIFTVAMTCVFLTMGSVPDTLIVSVFGCLGFECGALGWIKTSKIRHNQDYGNDQEVYKRGE